MKQFSKNTAHVILFIFIITFISGAVLFLSFYGNITGRAQTDQGEVSYIINTPPYLVKPIPNYTWERFKSENGPELDQYFIDPDGDNLTFTHSTLKYITVTYFDDDSTLLTPRDIWWGVEYVVWYAIDSYGLSAVSNTVILNVTYVEIPPAQPSSSGGGGGGGATTTDYFCTENWKCTQWSDCIGGKQVRTCIDINYCMTNESKPDTKRDCVEPSCYDGIKNCHNEECEVGIDCGGPCSPCATCYDGIKNCHDGSCEEEVDCGGPCISCDLGNLRKALFGEV